MEPYGTCTHTYISTFTRPITQQNMLHPQTKQQCHQGEVCEDAETFHCKTRHLKVMCM